MKLSYYEFYKEAYYKEVDRRNNLNTEIALQGTVLVAIVSGVFFMLTSLKSETIWLNWLFAILVSADTAAALGTAYYLTRSYYDFTKGGRSFGYLPKMRRLEDYRLQVNEADFSKYLSESFISISDQYSENNDHKTRLLTSSSSWMTRLMTLAAVIAVLYVGNFLVNNLTLKTIVTHEKQPEHANRATTGPAGATAAAAAAAAAATSLSASNATAVTSDRGTRSKNANKAQVK